MRIGLLGAAFDPPHLGHLLIAGQVLDFAELDEIWFLPTFKHTFAKRTITYKHRIAMTKLLIAGEPRMQLSLLEIEHKLDGNTVYLLPLLKKKYPKHKFTFIIGSDNLATFHKWGDWQELLKNLPFLVFPRAGYPLTPLYKGMQVLTHPLLTVTNISSTTIRKRAARGWPIKHFVTEKVENYIKNHGLYLLS